MQIRRRCRRSYCTRTSMLLLTFFSTLSTMLFLHHYFSRTTVYQVNVIDQIYTIDENDLDDARIKPTEDLYVLGKEYFNSTHLTCQYPKLMIDNEEVWTHFQPVKKSKPDCEKAMNWVYVDNGTFRLSSQALQKHGAIVCAYRPILRSKDDFSTMEGARLFPVVDKMPLVSDFFRADCRARDGSFYSNIHSGIMFDAGLHMRYTLLWKENFVFSRNFAFRHIWNPMVKTHLGYNVLIFGLILSLE